MPTPSYLHKISKNLPFYYGWIALFVAVLAMIATLPGRSIGIGLITEPLIADFGISRTEFAAMIFWATIAGALFSLLVGPAIDRFGGRWVLTFVLVALGLCVVSIGGASQAAYLLPLWILTRGFGQSALSATSLTIVGKWFAKRLSLAMGVFAVTISIGFTIVILWAGGSVEALGWRTVWSAIGFSILGLAVIVVLLMRRSPETLGLPVDGLAADETVVSESIQDKNADTFFGAMMHPAFWGFAVGSAAYNLVISGVTLLNESILGELGFAEYFQYAMGAYAFFGLLGNLIADKLAKRFGLKRLMAVAMLFVSAALLGYPYLNSLPAIIAHGALLGLAGGVVMVVFFASFGSYFGRLHLGKIQGTAQVLAVLGSATGPLMMSYVFDSYGSYAPAFYALSPVLLACGLFAWWMPSAIDD
ncbi:MAG: MFS transporter [Calditrichia bacterium]